ILQHRGMYPRYLPSGHLTFVSKGTLFAIPFDLDRLEVRGAPTRIGDVISQSNLGFGEIDFSHNGTAVYRTGAKEDRRTMRWLDSSGNLEPLGIEPAAYIYPRLSPDSTRVAYVAVQESSQDLWIYDFTRDTRTRLTNGQSVSYPAWSADSQFV